MIEHMLQIRDNVLSMPGIRQERAEEEASAQEEVLNEVKEPCPDCGKLNRSRVIGTGKNQAGHTIRKLRCSRCKKTYYDSIPIDDVETIEWTKNFVEKLSKVQEDGSTYAEKFNIPPEKLEEQHKGLQTFIEIHQKEVEAKKSKDEVEDLLQEKLKGMNRTLLKIKSGKEGWGSGGGIA